MKNKSLTCNVPERRFPEFLNDVEWEEKPLSKVGEIITGSTPATANLENYGGSKLFVSPADISDTRYITTTKTTLSEQGFMQTRHIKANSILFVCIGSTIGKVAQNKFDCATNQQINSIVPFDEYSNDFIYSALENSSSRIASLAGNHAVPIINKTLFSSVLIGCPLLPEQQKIADCLSSIDNLITAQSKKVEALKEHKKGLMQQLFPTDGKKVPKLRFPEFLNDGEWEIDEFRQKFMEVIDGDRGKNYPKSNEFSTSGYCLFLNAKNVTKNGFVFDEVSFITHGKDNLLRKGKLKPFDIVLTTRGSVGNFAYFSSNVPYGNIRINSGMVILRVNSELIKSDYLYYYCKSDYMSKKIQDTAFGNAQQQLTVSQIKKFQLTFPKPKEQKKIADFLNSIDNLITAQSKKVETLKEHKKGLMQQLFPLKEIK
jgi:type I restriction enzyme S subunit